MKRLWLLGVVMVLTISSTAWAAPLENNRNIWINVANDAGIKYNYDYLHTPTNSNPLSPIYNQTPPSNWSGTPDNSGQYYIWAGGGGLNAQHITTDPANTGGQTTILTTSSRDASGTFYLTDTGGRGFTDNAVLMLSVAGPIADNFSVHITAGGYTWTPNPVANVVPTAYAYVAGAVNETFSKSDLIYGPQGYKPGPGILGSWTLPLYHGEDIAATSHYLMFIDLRAGLLHAGTQGFPSDLIDGGAIRVEYAFTNLYSEAAFNVYGWCLNSNQGEGISWANDTSSATASSGYVVRYNGPIPLTMPLSPGWNFVSTPVQPSDTSIAAVLNDISPNLAIVWTWDASTRTWLRYRPSGPNNTLVTFDSQRGYWIYVNDATQFTITGTNGSNSVPLLDGWNLVGYNGADNTSAATGLQSIAGKWGIVWGWANSTWSVHDSVIPDGQVAGLPALTQFNRGKAYWIKVKTGQAGSWTQ